MELDSKFVQHSIIDLRAIRKKNQWKLFKLIKNIYNFNKLF